MDVDEPTRDQADLEYQPSADITANFIPLRLVNERQVHCWLIAAITK